MDFLSIFASPVIDFLFPKSNAAKKLEALSSADMISLFPPARSMPDDRIIAIFDYQNQNVKDLIWEIKYKGNLRLSKSSAEIIYEILCAELAERALSENFKNPLLIPMPLSNRKRRERGFSQTEMICKEIKKIDKENLLTYEPNLLKKIKHTESQARTHTKKERLDNLKHSMEVLSDIKQENYSIVLLDDVITTGATIGEARRALREAGFKKILAITLAH